MENEQIDLRIKALVKPECLIQDPPPPPPATLVYPEFFKNINPSYNAPLKMPDGWNIYDVNRKIIYYDEGWRYDLERQTNAPAGSVISVTENGSFKYFGRQHFKSAFNADYESRYYKSTDGVSWYNTFLDRAVQGEDSNLIQSPMTGLVWNFIRPSRIRDLEVQTLSTDVSNNNLPSRIKLILAHNTPTSLNRDVYCACPIIVEDDVSPKFLLFVSLYRKGDLGQDVEQLPPYNTDEHTVDGYLYYYDAGNLRILNNGQPIISRANGEQQSYNWATLYGDTIYINHATCRGKHTMSESQAIVSKLFTWKLADASKFI